jgi:cytochrome P450
MSRLRIRVYTSQTHPWTVDVTSIPPSRVAGSPFTRKTSHANAPEIWYLPSHTAPELTPLGPVIRVGPSIVSVQGTEAIQTIYSVSSKWIKPSQAPNRGISQITSHGCLHATDSLSDVKCRDLLAPSFSSETVASQQHVILNCADTALTVTEIACENEGGKVDVLQISRTYAFDVISSGPLRLSWLMGSGDFVRRVVAGTGDSFGKEGAFEFT